MIVCWIVFVVFVVGSFVLLFVLMVIILLKDGYIGFKVFVLFCFVVMLLWIIIGFWNVVIGLIVMCISFDFVVLVCFIDWLEDDMFFIGLIVFFFCVKDEDVDELEWNFSVMVDNLVCVG